MEAIYNGFHVRKTLCDSKSEEMLMFSLKLLAAKLNGMIAMLKYKSFRYCPVHCCIKCHNVLSQGDSLDDFNNKGKSIFNGLADKRDDLCANLTNYQIKIIAKANAIKWKAVVAGKDLVSISTHHDTGQMIKRIKKCGKLLILFRRNTDRTSNSILPLQKLISRRLTF